MIRKLRVATAVECSDSITILGARCEPSVGERFNVGGHRRNLDEHAPHAERSLDALLPRTVAALEAYAEGVNAWVESHSLPPEYEALELTHFEPWTALDGAAVYNLFSSSLAFDLSDIERTVALLFSESNTRFLCEVPSDQSAQFEEALGGVPHAMVGRVEDTSRLLIRADHTPLVDADLASLKEAWQAPLRW